MRTSPILASSRSCAVDREYSWMVRIEHADSNARVRRRQASTAITAAIGMLDAPRGRAQSRCRPIRHSTWHRSNRTLAAATPASVAVLTSPGRMTLRMRSNCEISS